MVLDFGFRQAWPIPCKGPQEEEKGIKIDLFCFVKIKEWERGVA